MLGKVRYSVSCFAVAMLTPSAKQPYIENYFNNVKEQRVSFVALYILFIAKIVAVVNQKMI